jgi:hypothetical protein
VTAVAQGEAFTNDDKAANQAMSAAFKYAMLQSFCIPTEDMGDADRTSPNVGSTRDPNLVNEAQWQELKELGAAAKAMFGGEWDRTREALLSGRTVSWETLSTGDAAILTADFKELLEGEPFDVEPISGVETSVGSDTPPEVPETVSGADVASESPQAYVARVEMMRKPELVAEVERLGLNPTGTAQELRAKIFAHIA